jgi:hypothetical protein
MSTYDNPSPEQLQLMRDRSFYLIKKYTSLTWLNEAVKLYEILLDEMVKLLNKPEFYINENEKMYRMFLEGQVPNEQAVELLNSTVNNKQAAYQRVLYGTELPRVFGSKEVDSYGTYWMPFLVELGLRTEGLELLQPEKYFLKWSAGYEMRGLMVSTVFQRDKKISPREDRFEKIPEVWNFSAIFKDPYRTPLYFPANIPTCPPLIKDNKIQAVSHTEIPVTGIYEPLFIDGKTGCPNYYLAGQTALEYPKEGTGDLEFVRWVLLWEDNRYLQGYAPPEEKLYLQKPPPPEAQAQYQPLRCFSSDICPIAGTWYSSNTNEPDLKMAEGQKFPPMRYNHSLVTIWYLREPKI